MQYMDIRFPHLGLVFSHVGRSIHLGNFQIMFYGLVVALGFIIGLFVAQWDAESSGQDKELYMDYFLWMVIPAIIGARLYYVVFSWDYYQKHLMEIFFLRQGGLGIVGGISTAVLVMFFFCKKRKYSMLLMLDTVVMGCLTGQIIGRWGNFFNREAFGSFTDGLLAMQIPVKFFEQVGRLNEIRATGLLDRTVDVMVDGQLLSYIQVHPTFLYEGLWNLLLLIFVLFYRKHKKFNGEILCIYMLGYGFGRFFIESLRVDQLTIGHTGIAATQVVCIVLIISALIGMILGHRRHIAKSQ